MKNYIESIKVNILDLLTGSIDFNSKLNIISGENGTLKTKLLQEIKRSIPPIIIAGPQLTEFETNIPKAYFHVTPTDQSNWLKAQAISPKRNSERRSVEETFQYFRSQGVSVESIITNRTSSQINDKTFESYPAFGELFYATFEKACMDGGNQKEKMIEVTSEFNNVIKKVFDDYELAANWNENIGRPHITIRKNGITDIPIENLSLGEQEVFSLISNIYTTRNSFDLFLIDEPEVHLNWFLEDKLFDYLDNFCEVYDKQIIVVTHSRAIFKRKFLSKIQYLFWNDAGKICVGNEITDELRQKISGEVIETIKLGDLPKTTFFVEDEAHKKIIKALSKKLNKEVFVSECGNSSNVKSLYKFFLSNGNLENSFFLNDGDNEGSPFPNAKEFIHLEKYCIQNYLFDFEVISELAGKSKEEIQDIIINLLKFHRQAILNKNMYWDFLFDRLETKDITTELLDKFDASKIYYPFLKEINFSENKYLDQYISICIKQNRLKAVFPKKLIESIETAIDVK